MERDHSSKHNTETESAQSYGTADAVIRDSDPESMQVDALNDQVNGTGEIHRVQPGDAEESNSAGTGAAGTATGVEGTAPVEPTESGHNPHPARDKLPHVRNADAEMHDRDDAGRSAGDVAAESNRQHAASAPASLDASDDRETATPDSGNQRLNTNSRRQSDPRTKAGSPPRISVKRPRNRPNSEGAREVGGAPAQLRHPIQSLKGILFKDATQSVPITKPEDKIDRILTMMRVLGLAMLESHQSTPDTHVTLERIARAYNMPPVRVVTLPTVIAIQVEGTDRRAEIGSVSGNSLRLDQSAAVEAVVEKATRGVIEPDVAIAQVEKAIASKPRFNWFVQLIGQILMTLAIGLLINPALPALPAYIVLGVIVGLLLLVGDKVPTLRIAMPVICAAVVTVVAGQILSDLTNEIPVRLIAPALVTFLPGLTLTLAALELTRDEVIAGSSRLIYGISQLLLLAFGVVIGLSISPDFATSSEVVVNEIGPWTPLLAIALLALGYVCARSAPEGSYLWLVLALAITYSAQRLGLLIVPPEFSGFFGALIVVPLSRFLARFRTAPSAIVTQLVSFWILVPGALGFIGFTEAASGSSQTVNTFVSVGMALFSIALGMLVGSSLVGASGIGSGRYSGLGRSQK